MRERRGGGCKWLCLTVRAVGARSIHGSVPSDVGRLSVLDWLGLSANQLTGTLPSELGQLGFVQALYFGANRLHGTLPTEMAHMRSLAELKVLDNEQLCGPLPDIRYKHALDISGTGLLGACDGPALVDCAGSLGSACAHEARDEL